ncbi:MAG: HAD hydrolase-like protein [Proteobacteria bacterium]|nr:HAD hydrolase-like protein [Pseudomonadota bacterium]
MDRTPVRTALFDLDGTLTDPGEGITRCVAHALDQLGLPPASDAQLRHAIGPPLRDSFVELGGRPNQIEALVEAYREVGLFENAVYPDIPELLEQLRRRGVTLLVATSKPTVFAERVLEHFELRAFFTGVYGSELDGGLSDKSELLAHARERSHFTPETSALVGDRRFDMQAARAGGLLAVGALWGYGSSEELIASGADVLAEKPRSVASLLPE